MGKRGTATGALPANPRTTPRSVPELLLEWQGEAGLPPTRRGRGGICRATSPNGREALDQSRSFPPAAGASHQLHELPGADGRNRSLSSLSLGHQASEINVSQCSALSRGSSGESLLPLPASGVSRHPWACRPLPPIFAFTWCLLCVSVLWREGALLSWSCLSDLGMVVEVEVQQPQDLF